MGEKISINGTLQRFNLKTAPVILQQTATGRPAAAGRGALRPRGTA